MVGASAQKAEPGVLLSDRGPAVRDAGRIPGTPRPLPPWRGWSAMHPRLLGPLRVALW